GLGGAADADSNKTVTASELIDYVSKQVPAATMSKQHPREFGVYNNEMRLAETDKPGIELAGAAPPAEPRTGGPLVLAHDGAGTVARQTQQLLERFHEAITAGRILPDQRDNAFDALQPLASLFTPQRYLAVQNELRVALENAAQKTLLRYLQ